MRRAPTGLSGLIAFDKPLGITSHDAIDLVRRATGERRIGHAGTLDPAASGLLIVCLGPAARLSSYLTGHDKRYMARIAFGCSTTTDDSQGEVVHRAQEPDRVLDPDFARSALGILKAMTSQRPPAFSAIKREGKKAYELARAGAEIELDERPISVSAAELVGIGRLAEDMGAGAGCAYWDISLTVSKGTYVRALARDLGEALGSRAHLAGLRRLQCGRVGVTSAVDWDAFKAAGETFRAGGGAQVFDGLLLDPVFALGYPRVDVDGQGALAATQGKRIPLETALFVQPHAANTHVALTSSGRLVGIFESTGSQLVARCVINGGVAGCLTL